MARKASHFPARDEELRALYLQTDPVLPIKTIAKRMRIDPNTASHRIGQLFRNNLRPSLPNAIIKPKAAVVSRTSTGRISRSKTPKRDPNAGKHPIRGSTLDTLPSLKEPVHIPGKG